MKRKILTYLSVAALAASSATLLPGSSHAAGSQEVNCGAIELSYDAPATSTTCMQLDQFGNQTEAKLQRLVAKGTSYELILTYTASKFRTYLPIRSLRHIIEKNSFFSRTDNWQAIQKFAGFDFAAFNGYGKAGDPPLLCAGFARYSGEPGVGEFEGGPGYKNLADGVYCVLSGDSTLIHPVDNFYRLVESVIGKLHLPR